MKNRLFPLLPLRIALHLLALATACHLPVTGAAILITLRGHTIQSKALQTQDSSSKLIPIPWTFGSGQATGGAVKPVSVRAGIPRKVPCTGNEQKCGIPVSVTLPAQMKSVAPGLNGIPVPETAQARVCPLDFPAPVILRASEPRYMNNATRNISYLSDDQGLTADKIYDIEEDRHHIFWISGGNCLIRYDGITFTNYTRMGKVPLQPKKSLIDSSGNLWLISIGKSGMIVRYDGNTFCGLDIPGAGPVKHFPACFEDSRGGLWFAINTKGVYHFIPDPSFQDSCRITLYTEENGLIGNDICCITEDHEGNIWMGADSAGLCRYRLPSESMPFGCFTHFTVEEGLSHNDISSVICDSKGNLWVGAEGGGISIFNDSAFLQLTMREGLNINHITDILEDDQGAIWIATHGGGIDRLELHSFDPWIADLTSFTYLDNLTSNYITKVLQDHAGNMLFGSFGGTLHVCRTGSFIHFTEKQGFEYLWITTPVEDLKGDIWFGSECGLGLCRFDGNDFFYYTHNEGLSSDSITCLLTGSNGDIWIGTRTAGMSCFDGARFTHYQPEQGLSDPHVTCLAEDHHGRIWIGSGDGKVHLVDGTSIIPFEFDLNQPNHAISDIFSDRSGNIWIGSYKGMVLKYDSLNLYQVSKEKNTPYDCPVFFIQDKTGRIWYRNDSFKGLIAIDPDMGETPQHAIAFPETSHKKKKIMGIETCNIISSRHVKFIVNDGKGKIFAGSSGIDVITLPDESDGGEIRTLHVDRDDGLKGDVPVLNSALIDSRNRLWYGHHRTLSMLDLNHFRRPDNTPEVQMNTIELNHGMVHFRSPEFPFDARNSAGDIPDLSEVRYSKITPWFNIPKDLSLPHTLNDMIFHYAAIEWAAPHRLQYRYRLEGLDREWRPLTPETKAIYTNLDPGVYTFTVMAIGAAGKWSDPFRFGFIIRPPWWKRWWAYTGYGLLILALVAYWRRYDLRKHRLAEALKLEKIRAEKLQEVDQIRSGFFTNISHEFRTPLTLILGPVEEMIRKSRNVDDTKQLSIVQRNAQRLQRLINQLLNLAMLEAGKMKLQCREEDLVP
ncbi:MAG: hypothetical protein JW861_09050, partial [Bacteroidales bacterium]|nr:hypothetical protein [Bacteroidales bacterium]